MTTNEIKVTFQLRYDSFDNWSSNNTYLMDGEVAIASINNQETVMIKVGPGNFNSLPWINALAADVYDWAKKSENEFIIWMNHLLNNSVFETYTKTEIDEKFNNIQSMSDDDIYEAIGKAGEGIPVTPAGQILEEMSIADIHNIIKN
jgi:hypothetical protein